MSTTTFESPQPGGDDHNRDLAGEVEAFLVEQSVSQETQRAAQTPAGGASGLVETPKVRERREEVQEARQLLEWQADDAPSRVETDKVRKLKRKVKEAAALRRLGDDPDMVAWRDQRAQRFATVACMTGVVIALLISSVGVQDSVAKALKAPEHSVLWWFSFLTESAMSLPLLSVVATQAYAAMRGHVVDRKSAEGKAMFRTEVWLLAYTLALQCWPVFSGKFSFLKLIVHSLAPVVAVLSVWALPAISQVFAQLHAPVFEAVPEPEKPRVTPGVTAPSYSTNTPGVHRAYIRRLIASEQLPSQPSAKQIQKATHCGMDVAREIRDEIAGTGGRS